MSGLHAVSLLIVLLPGLGCAALNQAYRETLTDCEQGDARACLRDARWLRGSDMSSPRYQEMRKYYHRACDGELVEACLEMKDLILCPTTSHPCTDDLINERRSLSTRACQLGHKDSCFSVLLTDHDPATTAAAALRVCALSPGQCHHALDQLKRTNRPAAATLGHELCARGPEACGGAGRILGGEEGLTLLETACTQSDWPSCTGLADARVAGDPDGARTLYRRACRGGHLQACERLGVLLTR